METNGPRFDEDMGIPYTQNSVEARTNFDQEQVCSPSTHPLLHPGTGGSQNPHLRYLHPAHPRRQMPATIRHGPLTPPLPSGNIWSLNNMKVLHQYTEILSEAASNRGPQTQALPAHRDACVRGLEWLDPLLTEAKPISDPADYERHIPFWRDSNLAVDKLTVSRPFRSWTPSSPRSTTRTIPANGRRTSTPKPSGRARMLTSCADPCRPPGMHSRAAKVGRGARGRRPTPSALAALGVGQRPALLVRPRAKSLLVRPRCWCAPGRNQRNQHHAPRAP